MQAEMEEAQEQHKDKGLTLSGMIQDTHKKSYHIDRRPHTGPHNPPQAPFSGGLVCVLYINCLSLCECDWCVV